MAERDEFGSFLVGFLIGGVTGAVVSLLLAPQSGEETRTYIKERAIEISDRASETAEQAYGQAEAAATDAIARAQELLKIAQDRALELQHQGQVVLEEQKAKLKKTAGKIGDDLGLPAD